MKQHQWRTVTSWVMGGTSGGTGKRTRNCTVCGGPYNRVRNMECAGPIPDGKERLFRRDGSAVDVESGDAT